MSLHRTKATLIGLLEAGRVNEWVVTEKLGDALKMKMAGKISKKLHMKIGDRYITELLSFLLFLVHFIPPVAEHVIWNQVACSGAWCWSLPLLLWML